MSNNVTFSIAGYTFDPGPGSITLSDAYNRTGSGELFSIVRSATIEGVLTNLGDTSCGASIACTMGKLDELDGALRGCNCARMVLTCNGDIILDTNVRVLSVQFDRSTDNWIFTIPYTIQVEWMVGEDGYEAACLSCLTSLQETWDVQYLDNNYQYNMAGCSGNPAFITVNHTVAATARDCCDTSGVQTPGWEVSKGWVLDHLGMDTNQLESSGVFAFDPSTFDFCDHKRVLSVDKFSGSYSVTESWVGVSNNGVPKCIEEFTVEHTQATDTLLNTYTISGTITGLEKRDLNHAITETKFESAESCWAAVEPALISRVSCATSPAVACPINPFPVSKTVGYSPVAGTITYSYTYNDRPTALVTGAVTESITISDTLRALRVNEVEIIGRAAGPILVSCNTTNAFNRSISISAVVPRGGDGCPPTGDMCTRMNALLLSAPDVAVQDLLCCMESGLNNSYDFVYRNQDSRQWEPISGVYNRNVNFIVSNCNANLPGGFC